MGYLPYSFAVVPGSILFSNNNEYIITAYLYISEANRARRKGTTFNFSGPYSEIQLAKLTNHTARNERYSKVNYVIFRVLYFLRLFSPNDYV